MRAAWLAAVVAAGCAEPAVEMQLDLPTTVPADFDLSCIGAVDVVGFSSTMLDQGGPDIAYQAELPGAAPACATIERATTLAELTDQLRGQIDVPLPSGGLAAVELRARVGTCAQFPVGEALLYGGGTYVPGASKVAVSVAANISCADRTTLAVQPIDMLGMIADPTHTCTPLTDGNGDGMFPGVIRPTRLTTKTSGPDLMMFETGTDFQPLDTGGTARLATFSATASDACIAVARGSQMFEAASCVNRGAPTLCAADPSTIELPVVTSTKVGAVFDDGLLSRYGLPVIGFAWEKTATAKAPLANATVTVTDPTRATVVYMEVVGGTLRATPATTTTASGVFFVYTNGISAITVSAPGHASQRLIVGAGNGMDGTALAVLGPQ